MKKKILFFMAAVACLCGCTDKEEIARVAADSFLRSYYSLDYSTAESFCTPEFAEWIGSAVAGMDDIPEYVQGKMKEASEETSYEIFAVDAKSVKGEAAVLYRLYASGLGKPLEKVLHLKVEGSTALVYAIE